MREGRWWGGEGEKTIMAEIPVRRPLGTGSTNEDTHGRRWPDSLARRATHGGVTKQGRGGGEEGGRVVNDGGG
uniref:Uncharacterized protein n=1 Tax=Oryza sativa subsp. japonica TaxID=39947 RepID=Q84NS7_ORYSJ|nr:hypothetical protein [Oryza sativa Japonica Group]